MKTLTFFSLLGALLVSLAAPASATTLDYKDLSAYTVEMGSATSPLVGGYKGQVATDTKFNSGKGFSTFDAAHVYLSGMTSILFTYTLSQTPSSVGYFITPNGSSSSNYTIDAYSDSSLPNQYFISVANLTNSILDLKTALKLKGITSLAAVSTMYQTSPVPLPAALPLFGLGLAGLAGYRRKQKKSAD